MSSSQDFETYLPVYDAVPAKWEEARPFLVEQLKMISNAVNIREVGWFIDDEILSGQQFFPAPVPPGDATAPQYRTILRKVIDTGALIAGINPGVAHGISFTTRFSLIDMWVAGTNSGTLTARVINGNDVLMDATDIIITSPQVFDRSYCVISYIQEI